MLPTVLFLEAPEAEYLALDALAKYLDLDEKTVRKLIAAGKLPQGSPKPDGKRLFWTKEAAAVARWIVRHAPMFKGGDQPPDDEEDG